MVVLHKVPGYLPRKGSRPALPISRGDPFPPHRQKDGFFMDFVEKKPGIWQNLRGYFQRKSQLMPFLGKFLRFSKISKNFVQPAEIPTQKWPKRWPNPGHISAKSPEKGSFIHFKGQKYTFFGMNIHFLKNYHLFPRIFPLKTACRTGENPIA